MDMDLCILEVQEQMLAQCLGLLQCLTVKPAGAILEASLR